MITVKTDTHLLLIDETAEIKEGELRVAYSLHGDVPFISEASDIAEKRKRKDKIIAAYPKLGDLPEFETLPPNAEEDVEKLAKQLFGEPLNSNAKRRIEGFITGYQQAKSETMFSLEDMRKCWDSSDQYYEGNRNFDKFIQSLTKKEYEFVPDMRVCEYCGGDGIYIDGDNNRLDCNIYAIHTETQPKIINGKIQGIWKLK